MKGQKIFLKSNLKFLRNRKKRSQELVADALKITRSKYTSYETGAVKNPPMQDLLNIATFNKISVDTLLKVDLSKLTEFKIRELEEGNDMYIQGTGLRVLATTVDKTNKENVEFVPIKAKAGYLTGYHDPDFIGKLPVFALPMLKSEKKFRVFPITGDSMLPFPDGAFMIGEFIQDWTTITDGSKCLVITKNDGFVLKELHNNLKSNRSFILKSLKQEYLPYEMKAMDILEIWGFKGYIDLKWPEQNLSGIDLIIGKVNDLKSELLGMK
jgi:transcriptional regulator with XRE-family HTH domain